MSKLTEKDFPSFPELPNKEHLSWNEGKTELLTKTPIFDIVTTQKTKDGKTFNFVEVEANDWVNIIPVFTGTDGKKRFVLERQYRHGSKKTTIEFPGGLVEKGEDPKTAAARELLEETGLVAGTLKMIGSVNPNSAIMRNRLSVFIAFDLENTGKFNWDDQEEIDVFSMAEDEFLNALGTGEMDNGVMLSCAYFYLKERGLKL